MGIVYHYTSRKNYRSIKKIGFLLPKSFPYHSEYFANQTACKLAKESVRALITESNYLVGIAPFDQESWERYGLLDLLMQYTSGEVLLAIPILEQKGFVREHRFVSPVYLKQNGDEELWRQHVEGGISPSQFVCRKYHREYIASTVPLKEYHGEYCLPEIWLSQKTPLDLVKIIEVTKICCSSLSQV